MSFDWLNNLAGRRVISYQSSSESGRAFSCAFCVLSDASCDFPLLGAIRGEL